MFIFSAMSPPSTVSIECRKGKISNKLGQISKHTWLARPYLGRAPTHTNHTTIHRLLTDDPPSHLVFKHLRLQQSLPTFPEYRSLGQHALSTRPDPTRCVHCSCRISGQCPDASGCGTCTCTPTCSAASKASMVGPPLRRAPCPCLDICLIH